MPINKDQNKKTQDNRDQNSEDRRGRSENSSSGRSSDLIAEEIVLPVGSNVSVTAKPGESAESLLRRFKYQVEESGLMDKLEEIRFYQKPSQRHKYEVKMRLQKIARARRLNR